jgi:hypothetical protein
VGLFDFKSRAKSSGTYAPERGFLSVAPESAFYLVTARTSPCCDYGVIQAPTCCRGWPRAVPHERRTRENEEGCISFSVAATTSQLFWHFSGVRVSSLDSTY